MTDYIEVIPARTARLAAIDKQIQTAALGGFFSTTIELKYNEADALIGAGYKIHYETERLAKISWE